VVHHSTVKTNNNSLGNRYHWFMAHCHNYLLKLRPHYVMIESTLWFDDVGVAPGLLPLKGHVCGQSNGAGDGLGTRLHYRVQQGNIAHSTVNVWIQRGENYLRCTLLIILVQ